MFSLLLRQFTLRYDAAYDYATRLYAYFDYCRTRAMRVAMPSAI